MEDLDVNVLYIHAPKTNDWITWMLNAGVFIFFCLGVVFLYILLKIASDVGHSLELLQGVKKTPEEARKKDEGEEVNEGTRQENNNNRAQLLITIYEGSPPKPNGGGGDGSDYFSRYCQLPGAPGVRRRESAYFGLPDQRPFTCSVSLPDLNPDRNRNNGLDLRTTYSAPNIPYFKNSSGSEGTVSTSFSNRNQNPTGTEGSSSLYYYGMPRNAPRSSELNIVVQKPSTSSGNAYVNSQRYKNASASSDLFESLNNGAPFPDFYSFS